jgi:large subunit ribosomal protein L15
MPLYRRLPKRGFGNGQFRKHYDVINVRDLEGIEAGTVVDLEWLDANGRITRRRSSAGLKVLGDGELGVAITVKAVKFSASAAAKIEAAGGTAEVI